MVMLADIVTGKTATADVFFLVAAIVFGLATLATFMRHVTVETRSSWPVADTLAYLGLTFLALAFLLL
jgi:hypothetical protein